MIMREYGDENKRGLDEDDSRESTPAMKKSKKAGNKLVETLKVYITWRSSLRVESAEC